MSAFLLPLQVGQLSMRNLLRTWGFSITIFSLSLTYLSVPLVGKAEGHQRHRPCAVCVLSRSVQLTLSLSDVWKAPKMGKMDKTGQISACVRGLCACVCVFTNMGACACVSVCTKRLQHGIRCLPWLCSIIFPEVGSLAKVELTYLLPSCSVDPWTLDYTWVTFFICLAFYIRVLQIQWSSDLCSRDFGHQVITPGPFCVLILTHRKACWANKMVQWVKTLAVKSDRLCLIPGTQRWSKRTNFCKSSSDLYMHAIACAPKTSTHTIN